MVNTNGQTLTEISHPFKEGTVSAAVLPIYAFKFKSTGNVAFNCQVKICKQGEEDQCQPVRCIEATTVAVYISFFNTVINPLPVKPGSLLSLLLSYCLSVSLSYCLSVSPSVQTMFSRLFSPYGLDLLCSLIIRNYRSTLS